MDMITFSCLLIVLVATYFGVYRNTKVFFLERKIIDGCYGNLFKFLADCDPHEFYERRDEYEELVREMDALVEKVSQWKKILSFKPIKLESWYTQEETDKIMAGQGYNYETTRLACQNKGWSE